MSTEIRPLTKDEQRERFRHRAAWVISAWGVFVDGKMVGVGGFCAHPYEHFSVFRRDARCWGYLQVNEEAKKAGAGIVRTLRAQIREYGREVAIKCEGPHAARLLKVLGFEVSNEKLEDHEVWIWQPSSQQSHS
jgi:hypothetical protein